MIGIIDILDLADDQACVVCGTERAPRAGKAVTIPGKKLWICKDHIEAFSAGRSVGNIDLSIKMVDTLARIQDDDTGISLRERVFDLIPTSRQRVMMANKQAVTKSPKTIYAELDRIVVGQEDAKRSVSVSVYEHLVRCFNPKAARTAENIREKRHILFIGPSGSGKTLISQTVAAAMQVPFVEADATSFSPTGFYGSDFDSIIVDLFSKSGNSTYTAERGAVFIDEFDKLAATDRHSSGRIDTLNSGTQNTLLKLIDGKRVKMGQSQPHMSEMMGIPEPPTITTNNILFMFGGAFPGIVERIARIRGVHERTMGFRQQQENSITYDDGMKNYELLLQAKPEEMYDALIEYGMSAELMGRIPIVVPLRPLNRDELRSYLLNTPQSPIKYQTELFAVSGHAIEFTADAIECLLDQAEKYATGTRSLSSMIRRSVSMAAFNYCDASVNKSAHIVIGADTINNPSSFLVSTP